MVTTWNIWWWENLTNRVVTHIQRHLNTSYTRRSKILWSDEIKAEKMSAIFSSVVEEEIVYWHHWYHPCNKTVTAGHIEGRFDIKIIEQFSFRLLISQDVKSGWNVFLLSLCGKCRLKPKQKKTIFGKTSATCQCVISDDIPNALCIQSGEDLKYTSKQLNRCLLFHFSIRNLEDKY